MIFEHNPTEIECFVLYHDLSGFHSFPKWVVKEMFEGRLSLSDSKQNILYRGVIVDSKYICKEKYGEPFILTKEELHTRYSRKLKNEVE